MTEELCGALPHILTLFDINELLKFISIPIFSNCVTQIVGNNEYWYLQLIKRHQINTEDYQLKNGNWIHLYKHLFPSLWSNFVLTFTTVSGVKLVYGVGLQYKLVDRACFDDKLNVIKSVFEVNKDIRYSGGKLIIAYTLKQAVISNKKKMIEYILNLPDYFVITSDILEDSLRNYTTQKYIDSKLIISLINHRNFGFRCDFVHSIIKINDVDGCLDILIACLPKLPVYELTNILNTSIHTYRINIIEALYEVANNCKSSDGHAFSKYNFFSELVKEGAQNIIKHIICEFYIDLSCEDLLNTACELGDTRMLSFLLSNNVDPSVDDNMALQHSFKKFKVDINSNPIATILLKDQKINPTITKVLDRKNLCYSDAYI